MLFRAVYKAFLRFYKMKRMGFRANLPTNQKVCGGTIPPQLLNNHCFMWCANSWCLLVFILPFQEFYPLNNNFQM